MKLPYRLTALLLSLLLLLTFSGCDITETLIGFAQGLADKLNQSEASSISSKVTVYEIPREDPAGNPISLPDSLSRIVSLSPSVTQNLLDLGMGSKLVAVDSASASLSGINLDLSVLDAAAPDLATVQGLDPQVVFANAEPGENPLAELKENGITVAYLPEAISLNDIMEDILFLGACTKADQKAEDMVFEMIDAMKEIKKTANTITTQKVVYIETSGPYATVGGKSILNEMVTLAGGKNAFYNYEGFLYTNTEKVLSLTPEVILTFSSGLDGVDPVEEICSREGWDAIPAVSEGQVKRLDFDYTMLTSNLVTYLKQVARAIYPALY